MAFHIEKYPIDSSFTQFVTRLYEQVLTGETRYLYLLHDERGTILEFLTGTHPRYPFVLEELSESRNLHKYYSIGGGSLDMKTGESASFRQQTQYRYYPYSDEFHTSLPATTLTSWKVGEGVYLGRISFINFVPNVFAPNINALICVDTTSHRLVGFNHSFYNMFSHVYSRPDKMIDLPLASLLAPTPVDIQRQYTVPFTLDEIESFHPVYSRDFANKDLGDKEELVGASGHTRDADGLLLDNREKDNLILTFLQSVDTLKNDVILSLQVDVVSGIPPFLVLGERVVGKEGLDENGYLVVTDQGRENCVLKKYGFMVCAAPLLEKLSGTVVLHLCKIASTLYVFINRKTVISYFDHNFLKNENAHLSIGLRSGCRALIRHVEISVRKTLKNRKYEQPSQLIVQLKNNRENHFALDRYYNYTLSSGTFNHVAGYFLTDVTAIQGKVVSLDEKYRRQLRRGERLKSLLEEQAARGDIFVGSGRRISEIKNTARTIAFSDATVLIDGPTGAGKEVLANYIHSHSSRKNGPFIKVDCSTIPRSLMESQLFGHEKGAFTGAIARSTGLFEQAHGGTLFLDEVSNLPIETQVKLLQFFNDFNITRVGGAKSIKLNVRSIIASNVSLEKLVKSGVFREDLYYRINVVYLKLPSLKERIEDIPELCRHFLEYFSAVNNKEITGFSPQAYKKLEAYDWPGNIRELKNVIERSVIFCDSDTITDLHIVFSKREDEDISIAPDPGKKKFHLSRTSSKYMIDILKKHGGNVSALAKIFNVTRAPLYQYFKKHKIDIEEFRKGYGE